MLENAHIHKYTYIDVSSFRLDILCLWEINWLISATKGIKTFQKRNSSMASSFLPQSSSANQLTNTCKYTHQNASCQKQIYNALRIFPQLNRFATNQCHKQRSCLNIHECILF